MKLSSYLESGAAWGCHWQLKARVIMKTPMKLWLGLLILAAMSLAPPRAAGYYDPGTQRWINRDPVQENGGGNLFAVVANNPIDFVDPLGLEGNPISSTLPGLSGSWNSNPTGAGGTFYEPGYLWMPPQPLPPPYPYPTYPKPAGADYWDTKWGVWAESGLQSDPVVDAAYFGIGAVSRGSAVCEASRWGRPGLQAGDWVMPGRPNLLNYARSFKWQPGLGNDFAAPWSGESFIVSPASLKWPSGWGRDGWIKGIFGQRIYQR
jgi:hypothetical protein